MSKVHEALCPEEYAVDYDQEIDCYIDSQIKENKLKAKFKELNSMKPIPGEKLHKYLLRTNWPHKLTVYTEGQNDDKPKAKPKRNVYEYGKSSHTDNTSATSNNV